MEITTKSKFPVQNVFLLEFIRHSKTLKEEVVNSNSSKKFTSTKKMFPQCKKTNLTVVARVFNSSKNNFVG